MRDSKINTKLPWLHSQAGNQSYKRNIKALFCSLLEEVGEILNKYHFYIMDNTYHVHVCMYAYIHASNM